VIRAEAVLPGPSGGAIIASRRDAAGGGVLSRAAGLHEATV
jgi:hypothetical protein